MLQLLDCNAKIFLMLIAGVKNHPRPSFKKSRAYKNILGCKALTKNGGKQKYFPPP
jgi:hypothetical protein